MAIFFGFHMPNFTFPGVPDEALFDHVVTSAQAVERAGFDLLTVMDHFYQIGGVGPESDPMLEAYTVLGALAARTSRIRLGTLVTGVTYRNPALLAKMVTTLDVISKGRAVMGIGAAWNESEHLGYGFAFPSVRERMDRLDEALTIIKRMFREERPSFQGRYYQVEQALNSPRPIQCGGPKILIGGGGEKRTLRLLARHGDIGHWFGGNLEDLARKKKVFERHCEAEGRDPSAVLLTVGTGLVLAENDRDAASALQRIPPARRSTIAAATIRQAADLLGRYIGAGFGGFTLSNQTLPTTDAIGLAGELINVVRRG
jgi:F420-dependent oxidoreductase-like protein